MGLKAAVIGLGGAGRTHLETYQKIEGVELVGICDSVAELASSLSQEHGVRFWTEAQALLEEARPEIVSIATPPATHLPLVEASAQRGVHTLVEKPMASTVAQCDAMIEAARRAGTTLMIAHKKRFLPTVQKLKSLIDGGFGQLRFAFYRYVHPGQSPKEWFWDEEDGGGPILENACHAADLMRFLMGDVVRVFAEGDNFYAPRWKHQIDGAAFTLRFESGAVAAVAAGMVSMSGFANEYLFATNEAGAIELTGTFDVPNRLRYARRNNPDAQETFEAYEDTFELEIRHFIECVGTGSEPLTSGEEGREAVRLCRAVKDSATLRKPIDLRH